MNVLKKFPVNQGKSRIEILPLLRAIAALMVATYHFAWHEDAHGAMFPKDSLTREITFFGVEGVYVFFVISGFIIPYSLQRSGYTLQNAGRFLLKRLVRLHPPYLAALLLIGLTSMAYEIWYWNDFLIDFKRILYHLVFLIPFTEMTWFNEVFWTLAIEFQYYIWMAFLFVLIARKGWWMRMALILFLIPGFLLSDHRFLFHFAPVFVAGISIFTFKEAWISRAEFFVTLLICSILAYVHLSPQTGVTTLLTSLVIAFVNVRSRLTDGMGEVSYSLYLTHGFAGGQLLYFVSRNTQEGGERYTLLVAALVVSLLFAWIFWYAVEVPSMKMAGWVKFKKSLPSAPKPETVEQR